MDPTSLTQLASWSGADFLSGNRDALVSGISHDTRTIQPGELYVALRGEHFDGSHFIKEAFQQGAIGVLGEGPFPVDLPPAFGILRSTDALKGLTALAQRWREELALRAVVLTGSNGKTSTKDFTNTLLKGFLQTTSTQGNFNNHIGLPLSILKASRSDQAAVWEIGMNHRGEIAPLAALAQPDIAMITNIGTAHIGFLGSREAIAREKGDLLTALSSDGVAILPAADDFCDKLASRTKARIIRVGIGVGELQATSLVALETGMQFQVSYQGVSIPAFLPVMGAHMVSNALFAIAAGLECGISLQEGVEALKKIQPSHNRLAVSELRGITLVDDAYNASPDSMEAALKAIGGLEATRRVGVLGGMAELGDYTLPGYQRVGTCAASTLDILIAVGSATEPMARAAEAAGMQEVYHVQTNEEATALTQSLIHSGDVLLIKGSKSTYLSNVVVEMKAALSSQDRTIQKRAYQPDTLEPHNSSIGASSHAHS